MALSPLDIVKSDTVISSPPLILVQLNEAVNNPYSSVIDIGKIIAEDQALTARLLKLANSPFYAYPSKVETITQAIAIIGTQQIIDLVMATSVMKSFKGIPEDFITIQSFWHHSIACGTVARTLATFRREANIERFFVAGIMHDVGRLIILNKLPNESLSLFQLSGGQGGLLHKAEMEALHFDHAGVGEALLKEWKLPPSLVEMVAYHHRPTRARQFSVEASVIHLADIIAHALQMGNSGERFVPPLDAKAWELIELAPGTLSAVFDQAERHYASAVQLLHPEAKIQGSA